MTTSSPRLAIGEDVVEVWSLLARGSDRDPDRYLRPLRRPLLRTALPLRPGGAAQRLRQGPRGGADDLLRRPTARAGRLLRGSLRDARRGRELGLPRVEGPAGQVRAVAGRRRRPLPPGL